MTYVLRGEISSQDDYNAARDRFARIYVDSMLVDGLDRWEEHKRANILFWSGEKKQAKALLQELGQVEDKLTQQIDIQLITLELEDGDWDNAEHLMKEYRVNHPPDPDAPVDLCISVDDLAGRYNNNDRPEDAIRVIIDEIDHLPFDYPYSSFSLMMELVPLMIETERVTDLRELIAKFKESFSESLEEHLALPVPEDSTAEDYEKLTEGFEAEIGQLEGMLAGLDLIGRKAPSLNALHVFNADSSFTIDRCMGKITIMDFWTTWCIACVIGYVELSEIYSDYEGDIAILGVTSFQGLYYDMDSGEREGSKDEPLSQGRETEIVAEYIRRHKISWPCIISDRPASDPRYYINGFPTYVILDREGNIRYMHMGVGKQRQLRRVIDRLSAVK